jgi:hypothetical protein
MTIIPLPILFSRTQRAAYSGPHLDLVEAMASLRTASWWRLDQTVRWDLIADRINTFLYKSSSMKSFLDTEVKREKRRMGEERSSESQTGSLAKFGRLERAGILK